jgi:hypothetical protein
LLICLMHTCPLLIISYGCETLFGKNCMGLVLSPACFGSALLQPCHCRTVEVHCVSSA